VLADSTVLYCRQLQYLLSRLSPWLTGYESKISEILKSLKFCSKILNTVKVRNYKSFFELNLLVSTKFCTVSSHSSFVLHEYCSYLLFCLIFEDVTKMSK
jgi:hypothetical protein